MKRIFLATSFSKQVNYETGEVLPEFRASIEAILASLREQPDVAVFCAIEKEGWKISDDVPDKGVRKDIEELDAADVLVALVHDKSSTGVQFEIGYAVGKDKQVVLAMDAQYTLAYFNQGLVGAGLVTLVTYDTPADLVTQLPIAVNAHEERMA